MSDDVERGEAEKERAAVVDWLRNPAGKGSEDWVDAADEFADAIEAGDHLKGTVNE